MNRADTPLTEDIIAAIMAYIASGERDASFVEAVSRVAAAIIADEAREQSVFLGLEYTIDSAALAQEWVIMVGPRIAGVNDTTAIRIKELLVRALEDEASVYETAQRLKQTFATMSEGRAKLIARTEVLGATNFAAWRTFLAGSIPFKRWVATMDDRVRDSHAEANGQLRGVSEAFDINGNAMMYPGDPDGPVSEVANCRCIMVPETNARSSIWTMTHVRAIWRAYIARAVAWDTQMLTSVRHEFHTQQLGIASILHRYVS